MLVINVSFSITCMSEGVPPERKGTGKKFAKLYYDIQCRKVRLRQLYVCITGKLAHLHGFA